MINEINEIPVQAIDCYHANRDLQLPLQVPYIGMGSSFYAPLCLKYTGKHILPEQGSELFYAQDEKRSLCQEAVLLSQSGKSSETLWCRELVDTYTAITNDPCSDLATHPKAKRVIELHAGVERASATKSFVNTLISLYCGLGFSSEIEEAIQSVEERMNYFEETGRRVASSLTQVLEASDHSGLYVIGSGPNYGVALQGALILSECIKHTFCGLSMGQYDHGPKETAKGSFVLAIHTKNAALSRSRQLMEKIYSYGATVQTIEEFELEDSISPIATIMAINFTAYFVAESLGMKATFDVGEKVTEVE